MNFMSSYWETESILVVVDTIDTVAAYDGLLCHLANNLKDIPEITEALLDNEFNFVEALLLQCHAALQLNESVIADLKTLLHEDTVIEKKKLEPQNDQIDWVVQFNSFANILDTMICNDASLDNLADELRDVSETIGEVGFENEFNFVEALSALIDNILHSIKVIIFHLGIIIRKISGIVLDELVEKVETPYTKREIKKTLNTPKFLLNNINNRPAVIVRKAIAFVLLNGNRDLEKVNLSNTDLNQIDFNKANLNRANLESANLNKANLTKTNLGWANLHKANLGWANLHKADLRWANLTQANLVEADLSRAKLIDANLTQASLYGADLIGVDLIDAKLIQANLIKANLYGANLRNTDLTGANLTGANLTGANLTGANLTKANLTRADLTGADLTGADFSGVNLFGTNLTRTNLIEADLIKAINLRSARL